VDAAAAAAGSPLPPLVVPPVPKQLTVPAKPKQTGPRAAPVPLPKVPPPSSGSQACAPSGGRRQGCP
jgi:hypothetical protein